MSPYNVNPAELLQLIQKGSNPEQLMMSVLERNASSNPMMQNFLSLAKTNDTRQIEDIARNMCRERGLDFDKEFTNFKHNLGLR